MRTTSSVSQRSPAALLMQLKVICYKQMPFCCPADSVKASVATVACQDRRADAYYKLTFIPTKGFTLLEKETYY